MKLFICKSILIFFIALFSDNAVAKLFEADEFVLDNGLHCVVIQNHRAPLVKHMVWYKVGSVDEKKGKSGSAHLLEHLMFRGSKKVRDGEFNAVMHNNGVDSNAFTSHDVTVYHQFSDITKLELLMAFEADRMQNLKFDKKAFEAEQKIVFQERMQMVENNPSAPFYENINSMLFGLSPYGYPVTGFTDEIKKITYDDIYDYYKDFYAPNNAILVISGDINIDQAKELVQKYYASIPRREVKQSVFDDDSILFSKTLEMKLPNIKATKVVNKYLLDNYKKMDKKYYNYIVLAEYLGGGDTSELYKNLVVNEKKAVSINVGYSFVSRGRSVFHISSILNNGVDVSQFNELLDEALYNTYDNLDDNKLNRIKRKILSDLIYANDNPEDAAYTVGFMLANGFSLDEVQNYEKNISEVNLDGVKAAFKDIFENSSSVKGVLKPEVLK